MYFQCPQRTVRLRHRGSANVASGLDIGQRCFDDGCDLGMLPSSAAEGVAGGYWFADAALHLGNFSGIHVLHAADYFYFSVEAYTSFGVGNLYPVGNLRLLAGTESLSGLLLVGWSTSYTFLAMTRYWDPG